MLLICASARDHLRDFSMCTHFFRLCLIKYTVINFQLFRFVAYTSSAFPCCVFILRGFALRTVSFSFSLTLVPSPTLAILPHLDLSTNASRAVLRLIPLTALAEHVPYRPRRLAAYIDSCQSTCAVESGKSASRLSTPDRRFHSSLLSRSVIIEKIPILEWRMTTDVWLVSASIVQCQIVRMRGRCQDAGTSVQWPEFYGGGPRRARWTDVESEYLQSSEQYQHDGVREQ